LINDPPAVFPDYYTVPEDSSVTVSTVAGILVNDIDPEGDPITAVLIDDVDHGILSFDSDGSFFYRPAPDYSGIDQFIYRAVDDEGMYSEVGTVTIGVNATNDIPIAFNDSYSMSEDDTLAVLDSLGVLINDIDVDPDQILSSILISNVSHGTLFTSDSVPEQIIVGNIFNGLFLYSPDEN
jgi:VCBS repeat-containing protein